MRENLSDWNLVHTSVSTTRTHSTKPIPLAHKASGSEVTLRGVHLPNLADWLACRYDMKQKKKRYQRSTGKNMHRETAIPEYQNKLSRQRGLDSFIVESETEIPSSIPALSTLVQELPVTCRLSGMPVQPSY